MVKLILWCSHYKFNENGVSDFRERNSKALLKRSEQFQKVLMSEETLTVSSMNTSIKFIFLNRTVTDNDKAVGLKTFINFEVLNILVKLATYSSKECIRNKVSRSSACIITHRWN